MNNNNSNNNNNDNDMEEADGNRDHMIEIDLNASSSTNVVVDNENSYSPYPATDNGESQFYNSKSIPVEARNNVQENNTINNQNNNSNFNGLPYTCNDLWIRKLRTISILTVIVILIAAIILSLRFTNF